MMIGRPDSLPTLSLQRGRRLLLVMMILTSPTAAGQEVSESRPPAPRQLDSTLDQRGQAQASESDSAATPLLAVAEVSEKWLAEMVEQQFEKLSPVELVVLAVLVQGTSRTTGTYTVHCREAEQSLAIEVKLQGESISSTHAQEGPASISTVSTTSFEASKSITLKDGCLIAGPTAVNATALSRHSNVSTRLRLGSRLVRRIAHRRMRRSEAEVDAIAEREAERRIVAAVDQAVEKARQRLEQRLQQFRQMASRLLRNDDRSLVQLETTDGGLRCRIGDGGGHLVRPLYLGIGNPEDRGKDLQVWLTRRVLVPIPDQVSQGFSRMAALAAILSSSTPQDLQVRSWSLEVVNSEIAPQLQISTDRMTLRLPLRPDSLLRWADRGSHLANWHETLGTPATP